LKVTPSRDHLDFNRRNEEESDCYPKKFPLQ
jgi:hypothetical protein